MIAAASVLLRLGVRVVVAAADTSNMSVANKTVLVFGDSWGSLGPSWHEIQDMFDRHNVPAEVMSSARGGTQACQWAKPDHGTSLALEAAKAFPNGGPDYVWYTLGGNDLVDHTYEQCSEDAATYEESLECLAAKTLVINNCTQLMLKELWKVYPKTKVMQCGYDLPCYSGSCIPAPRMPYCKTNVSCLTHSTVAWQAMLLDPLNKLYGKDGYTGINIVGSVQMAGGVSGASPGKPVLDQGSPCSLMTECVHPTHGKAGATAVGEAFWSMYFAKEFV